MMSMSLVIWQKMSTLWPTARSFGKNRSRSSNFPLDRKISGPGNPQQPSSARSQCLRVCSLRA